MDRRLLGEQIIQIDNAFNLHAKSHQSIINRDGPNGSSE